MDQRFKAALVAMGLALAMVAGARLVLSNGILDALCSMYHPGDVEWVLLGCTSHGDPSGG